MFWKIATSALLALTWSLPAFASHDRRREERREERYDAQIEQLAHELEESVRHVDRQVRDARHSRRGHHDRYPQRAVRAVHELKGSARNFRRAVGRHRNSSYPLSRDLQRVVHAYDDAVHQLERIQPYAHVTADLRAVGIWIDRIAEHCESSNRNTRFNGHARRTRYDRLTRSYGERKLPSREFWSIAWKSPEHSYSR